MAIITYRGNVGTINVGGTIFASGIAMSMPMDGFQVVKIYLLECMFEKQNFIKELMYGN